MRGGGEGGGSEVGVGEDSLLIYNIYQMCSEQEL